MVARASQVIPIPDHVSFDEGAAYPIQTLTAWHILHTSHHVGPGPDRGGAFGGGRCGNRRGANCQGCGRARDRNRSSASKAALAKEYGADEVIDYAKGFFRRGDAPHRQSRCGSDPRRGRQAHLREGHQLPRSDGPSGAVRTRRRTTGSAQSCSSCSRARPRSAASCSTSSIPARSNGSAVSSIRFS